MRWVRTIQHQHGLIQNIPLTPSPSPRLGEGSSREFINMAYIVLALCLLQADPERLTLQEEKELNEMLAVTLKAKPGEYALQLADASIKRQFDLSSRIAQLGMLKINRAIHDKKYESNSDFVGFDVDGSACSTNPRCCGPGGAGSRREQAGT